MAKDPEQLAHQEWLGYVQPVGLVVSIPALLAAQAHINRNIIPDHQRFLDCLPRNPHDELIPELRDFAEFTQQVLGWRAGDLEVVPPGDARFASIEVPLPEYSETLRPTHVVRELEPKDPHHPWMMLIQLLPAGTALDDAPESKDRTWHAAPQPRFERLLRETRVPFGLLCNTNQIRIVYAPRGETSGFATFSVAEMAQVAGRPIFAALHMLLCEERLFSLGEKHRLPAILADSRKYQNVVSTQLAEQVLAALYELVRGFQAADDQSKGELLREVLAENPNHVYQGLLTVLMRLVFVLYAEDRGLLSSDPIFANYYSITGLFERLRADDGRYPDTMDQRYGAWAQFLTLFRLIYEGGSHGEFKIPPRHGYLFDPDRYNFLEGRPWTTARAHHQIDVHVPRISDGVIFRVLNNLLILDGERLSYRTLDVEQIGSVYETMMGFDLEVAQGRSIAIKPKKPHGAPTTINLEALLATKGADRAKWLKEKADQDVTGQALDILKKATTIEELLAALEKKIAKLVTPNVVSKGAIVLQPSDERRKSGSHYTPRSLTEPIVRTTLKPILEQLQARSASESVPIQARSASDCVPNKADPDQLQARSASKRLPIQARSASESVPIQARSASECVPNNDDNVIHDEHIPKESITETHSITETDSHSLALRACMGDPNVAEINVTETHSHSLALRACMGDPNVAETNVTETHSHSLALRACMDSPTPDQILALKVCDPAMGSGAFLVEVCRQLGDELVKAWHVHKCVPKLPPDEDELLHARRLVAQRCLYGVDKNPMAVDLSKLSLWLATLAKDHPFTFLDHSLRAGDSLVGLTRDQISGFHWSDAEIGKRNRVDEPRLIRDPIADRIRRATEYRQKILAARDDNPYDDLQQKLAVADEALSLARLAGDLVISAYFSADKDRARVDRLNDLGRKLVQYVEKGDLSLRGPLAQAVSELNSGLQGIRPFHWQIEFPEVFTFDQKGKPTGGFDVFVGNPPFMGGKNISGSFSSAYLDFLTEMNPGSGGQADLVAYFFRCSFRLLRTHGAFGLLATNTIAQGDTRKAGLYWISFNGGTIFVATRRLKWPGAAAVTVSVVHIARGKLEGPYWLDGKEKPKITSFLFDVGPDHSPQPLGENAGKSFCGVYIYGVGFTFDDADPCATTVAEMEHLIAKNSLNKQRIFPYIGGQEVLEHPRHAHDRFVIDFGTITESEARKWPDLMSIVEAKVKPERLAQKRERRARYWWQFGETSPGLAEATKGLTRVLMHPFTSSHLAFAFIPAGVVIASPHVIFPIESNKVFCVLQSRPHEFWVRFFASSLEDRLRYTASDCFETFPFPPEFETIAALETAGNAYYEFRAALMIRNNEGLTKTYNRFHDPDERSPDILELRRLHAEMDRTVLEAYGWHDLAQTATCEFLLDYEDDEDDDDTSTTRERVSASPQTHSLALRACTQSLAPRARKRKKPWRYRWPDDFRDEVLARLLELNKQRAEQERLTGLATKGTSNTSPKRKQVPSSNTSPNRNQVPSIPSNTNPMPPSFTSPKRKQVRSNPNSQQTLFDE